jgi:hypothetical protein
LAGEQFAKFVKIADISMDREKLAMYFNTVYATHQISRTYTNNFIYFQQSLDDLNINKAAYYISTDNTIISNGKYDRQYKLDNQYFRQANSVVQNYNAFGFFDNPAVTAIPEFESSLFIQDVNTNKAFDMYLTNEVNYIKDNMTDFWKSSSPNFVDEFPIVTVNNQPYIYLKNDQMIDVYQPVGYYQDYFITLEHVQYAVFTRLSDMQRFLLRVFNDMYDLFGIWVRFFYLFIYNNELYCVVFHSMNTSTFPNVLSGVYKVTVTGISGNYIVATYTLINSYSAQAPLMYSPGLFEVPQLVYTNIYKNISFNDMLYNPVRIANVFCNATLQNAYIVKSIYPTLSTYQDKYLVFKAIGKITQSSSTLYIRDNIIYDKSLDPNGRPIFYFEDDNDYQFAHDSITNKVIMFRFGSFYRLNYIDILNGLYYNTSITYINSAYELLGAHNGWFYYVDGYSSPKKITRVDYTTLTSQDIITGIGSTPIYHIQINSILYVWFMTTYPNYRIHKIDMTSPSNTLYVDVPYDISNLFFDIPASNIFDSQFNLLEFDFVNHTYTSRHIIESTDTSSVMAINDSGLYKVLPNENSFEYDSAERTSSNHDSPYVDKSYLMPGSSLTKIQPTTTKYRSTYSIYKLVYAGELSLDDPKTLETTIR